MEIFSGVEIIPPITVSQSVYGDAYPLGGGSWNPVLNQYFSTKFTHSFCSLEIPIHIKEFLVVIMCIRAWGEKWTGQRIILFCDNDSVCDTCTYLKPKDPELQRYLREYLFWVCRYNCFPILQKISSGDNYLADFISRNHETSDIDAYFASHGYPTQNRLEIPDDWYRFKADW